MVKEHIRKCSYCGQNGHNSRTCNNNNVVHWNRNGNIGNGNGNGNAFKLFGVTIMEKGTDSMKKSLSMDNLAAAACSGVNGNDVVPGVDHDHEAGYLSDGLIHNKRRKAAHERKKGTIPLIYIYIYDECMCFVLLVYFEF